LGRISTNVLSWRILTLRAPLDAPGVMPASKLFSQSSKVLPVDSLEFTCIQPSAPSSSSRPPTTKANATNVEFVEGERDVVVDRGQPKKSGILGRVGGWLSQASKRSWSLKKNMKYPMKNPFIKKDKDRLVHAEQASHDRQVAKCAAPRPENAGPEKAGAQASHEKLTGKRDPPAAWKEEQNQPDLQSESQLSFHLIDKDSRTPSLIGIGVDVDEEGERRVQCLLPQLRVDVPIPEEGERVIMKFSDRESVIRFLADLRHMDVEAVRELFPQWPDIEVADVRGNVVPFEDVLGLSRNHFPLTVRCTEKKVSDGVVPHALSHLVMPQYLDEQAAGIDCHDGRSVDMQRRYDDMQKELFQGDLYALCDPWSFVIVDELDFNYDQEREEGFKRPSPLR